MVRKDAHAQAERFVSSAYAKEVEGMAVSGDKQTPFMINDASALYRTRY
jgi:hypothetical protein